jgi:putative Ca2+/H+ antiporter (TMEM165/GDT1 family)
VEAFVASFIFIILAEMGDKTQLLAMSFAMKYKASQVLLAVFLATIFNHALAVIAGHFLTTIIPMDIVSFAAALSFIVFGLWTIRGDELDREEKKESRFGPVITVGLAFFLAEMGDKTQLATLSLAMKYQSMFHVLLGTTLGMIAADAIGIILGVMMQKSIPQKVLKWISAIIFVLFGFISVYHFLAGRMTFFFVLGMLTLLAAGTIFAGYRLTRNT